MARGSRFERLSFAKKGSHLAPQASKKGRWVPERLNMLGAGSREEEEEEDEMVDLVHNFGARKRKRGASFKQTTGTIPEVVGETSQQPSGESSNVQVIVVSDSPEMGFHG